MYKMDFDECMQLSHQALKLKLIQYDIPNRHQLKDKESMCRALLQYPTEFKHKQEIERILKESPPDIIYSILSQSNIPVEDILNVCKTNKRLKQICQRNRFQYLIGDKWIDENPVDPLMSAVRKNQPTVLNILIEKFDFDPTSPSAEGEEQLADIEEFGFSSSDFENEAIVEASRLGHLEIVKELLKYAMVDPSARGNEAILLASKNRHLKVVQELLKDNVVRLNLTYSDLERIETNLNLNLGNLSVENKNYLKKSKIDI